MSNSWEFSCLNGFINVSDWEIVEQIDWVDDLVKFHRNKYNSLLSGLWEEIKEEDNYDIVKIYFFLYSFNLIYRGFSLNEKIIKEYIDKKIGNYISANKKYIYFILKSKVNFSRNYTFSYEDKKEFLSLMWLEGFSSAEKKKPAKVIQISNKGWFQANLNAPPWLRRSTQKSVSSVSSISKTEKPQAPILDCSTVVKNDKNLEENISKRLAYFNWCSNLFNLAQKNSKIVAITLLVKKLYDLDSFDGVIFNFNFIIYLSFRFLSWNFDAKEVNSKISDISRALDDDSDSEFIRLKFMISDKDLKSELSDLAK